jgi:hypothetical protein
MQDGEPFIARLEQAVEAGDADFIEANMPRLERLIGLLQERAHQLAQLQCRARLIRDAHEPPAAKRVKRR